MVHHSLLWQDESDSWHPKLWHGKQGNFTLKSEDGAKNVGWELVQTDPSRLDISTRVTQKMSTKLIKYRKNSIT